jgi:hypothetical protein
LTSKAKAIPFRLLGTGGALVRFLHDTPADVDYFGPHSAIARAIVQAISEDHNIRVVGLLGSWGSGKSTVIRQIAKRFEDEPEFLDYILFEYDTWLSQNDPPRRAFMEALISTLTRADGPLNPEHWDKRLKELKGEIQETLTTKTPVLTAKSVSLLKSYVAAGLGLFLLNKSSLDKVFSLDAPVINHVVFTLGLALFLLAPLNMLRIHVREVEVEKLKPEERTVVPRLLKKEIETEKTTTAHRVEATSIEFREAFGDLAKDVAAAGKRLIIVLDNIDRLSDEEALAQWSTVRSFFVDRHGTGFPAENAPVVIIPVDLSSISRIFVPKGSEDKSATPGSAGATASTIHDDFAQSYLDKTFDVVFTVREPALGDWRKFFDERLQEAVGSSYSSREIHDARRLYEAYLASAGKKPTPRGIIRFANHVTALALEAPERMPLAILFVYVLNRKAIEGSIAEFVSGDRDYTSLDPDWKLTLASIHFLVERSRAVGPLLRDDLTAAIAAGDPRKAGALVEGIDGAGDLLVEIAKNPSADENGIVPVSLVAAIVALVEQHGSSILGSGHWRDELDRELKRLFLTLAENQGDLSGLAPVLEYLGARVDQHGAQELIEQGELMIEDAIDREALEPAMAEAVGLSLQKLVDIADTHQLEAPVIAAPSNDSRALTRQFQLERVTPHWQLIDGPDDGHVIQKHLASLLTDAASMYVVPDLIRMLMRSPSQKLIITGGKDTNEFLAASDAVINDPAQAPSLPTTLLATALLAIGNKDVLTLVRSWSDAGLLTQRLNEAAGAVYLDAIAALLGLGVGTEIHFAVPAISWPAEARTADIGRKILDNIGHWNVQAQQRKLWAAIRSWPNAKEPLQAAREQFIDGVSVEYLDVKDLVQRASETIAKVGGSAFLSKIASHSKFSEAIASASVENLLILIAYTSGNGPLRQQLMQALRQRLLASTAEEWRTWLLNGSSLFDKWPGLHALDPILLTRQTGAAIALETAAADILVDRAALKRWKMIVAHGNAATAGHAYQAMIQAVRHVADTNKAISDLRALGDVQMHLERLEPQWSELLSRIVEHQEGRAWVKQNHQGIQRFVRKLDDERRRAFGESLQRLARDTREGRRLWGERALHDFLG